MLRDTLIALIVLTLSLSTGIARADDTPSYRLEIATALERYRAADWEGARAAFERAYAIEPGARTLRGIALSAYYAHDYPAAATAFERALADERQPLSDEQRAEARDLLGRTYLNVGQVTIGTRPETANARVDGNAVDTTGRLLLVPGHYRVDVTAPGCQPRSQDIEVVAGQQLNLYFELAVVGVARIEPTAAEATHGEPSAPQRNASETPASTAHWAPSAPFWIAASATAAFAVTAGTFALLTHDELGDLREACARRGCTSDVRSELWRGSPIETYQTLTNVALVATAIGAGTSLVLLVLDVNADTEVRSVSLGVRGPGVQIDGRF